MTREELIVEQIPNVERLAGWFYETHAPLVPLEELKAEAMAMAVKAVDSYDPSKGRTLRNWVHLKAKGALLDLHRRSKKHGHTEQLGEVASGVSSVEMKMVTEATIRELTPRRMLIVELVAEGKSNAEIAEEVGCSILTLKNTLTMIFAFVGVRNRTALAARYLKNHPEVAEQIERKTAEKREKGIRDRATKRRLAWIARLEEKLRILKEMV